MVCKKDSYVYKFILYAELSFKYNVLVNLN